jgi:hypothetical protein
MPEEITIPFTKIRIGRFLFLLISLMLVFTLRAFLEDFIRVTFLMDFFVSVVLFSGIYAASQKKHIFYISLILASPALIAQWSRYFMTLPSSFLVGKIFAGLFFAFMVIIILDYIFKEKVITADIIIGAICVYFLIGMMWASIFSILEILQPGSFQMPESMAPDQSNFIYHSFVTLTTLGYGDITPLTAPSRSMSVLEAITGQLYIAVLIARLVGIHIAQSMERE